MRSTGRCPTGSRVHTLRIGGGGQPTPPPGTVYLSTEARLIALSPLSIAPRWRSFTAFMTSAGFSTGPPDGNHADEPGLVAQVQQGNTEAYAVLVRRHLPRAQRIAWRVLRHREESEDAVFMVLAFLSGIPLDGPRRIAAVAASHKTNYSRVPVRRQANSQVGTANRSRWISILCRL